MMDWKESRQQPKIPVEDTDTGVRLIEIQIQANTSFGKITQWDVDRALQCRGNKIITGLGIEGILRKSSCQLHPHPHHQHDCQHLQHRHHFPSIPTTETTAHNTTIPTAVITYISATNSTSLNTFIIIIILLGLETGLGLTSGGPSNYLIMFSLGFLTWANCKWAMIPVWHNRWEDKKIKWDQGYIYKSRYSIQTTSNLILLSVLVLVSL